MKKRRLISRLRRGLRSVLNEQATPTRLGAAVALGVLLGCTPLYGLQTILCVVLAQVLRLNKLAVLGGVQISAPPITPLIVIASIQVGHRLLHGSFVELSFATVKATPGKELLTKFFGSFALGGVLLGLFLGAIFGALTAWVVRRRQRAVPEPSLTDDEIDGLHDRLDRLPRKFRHYGAWKVRLDPVYPMALAHLSGRTRLFDLGAGIGILGALVHERSPSTAGTLVEWDVTKAEAARSLLDGIENLQVVTADGRGTTLEQPDAIALFDVLHYSPLAEQQAWLGRCVDALVPGGVILIRELDVENARFGLSQRLEERAVKGGWNQGESVVAWPISQLRRFLEERGLTVEIQPCGRGLFSANALVVAHKPTL